MSTPETPATQQTPPADVVDNKAEPTLEEKYITAEKRRKDTQAAYTKSQQALKALEAEKEELIKQLHSTVKVTLTTEEQEKLDSLMYNDPQAWRIELNKLEQKTANEARAKIEELTGPAKLAAEQSFELSRRQQVLEEFNASSEVQITEALIADEVPPRITKKLAEGKISFEDFLEEVKEYVTTKKVVRNEDTPNQPNISEISGGKTPSTFKPEKGLSQSYVNDIY